MKTKKILIASILFVGVASITSCKKAYSCECVTITKITGYSDGKTTVSTPLSEKMKEKQAVASCKATADQMNEVNKDTNKLLNDPASSFYYNANSTCTVK